jgi:phosphatidylserine/phosphatidylglycerophosphate/cardiolipin synthase-like enzyme
MYENARTNLNGIRSGFNHQIFKDNIVQPHFENIESVVIEYINSASYVIGCIAWLTNMNVIDALTRLKGVKIIVNKEEYLHPDMNGGQKYWHSKLRHKYNSIPDLFAAHPEIDSKFTTFTKITNRNDGAIMTCGVINCYSKLHHKFMVFFNEEMNPIGIWTGSYNFSDNSNYSLENGVYITDKITIDEYIKEFFIIYNSSEPYIWKSGLLHQKSIDDNH